MKVPPRSFKMKNTEAGSHTRTKRGRKDPSRSTIELTSVVFMAPVCDTIADTGHKSKGFLRTLGYVGSLVLVPSDGVLPCK